VVDVDGDMDDATDLNPKFSLVIWLLLQAWAIALIIVALTYSIPLFISFIFTNGTVSDLSESFFGGLSMLFLSFVIGALISVPIFILAGIFAVFIASKLARHPWVTTIATSLVGVPLSTLYISITFSPNSTSHWYDYINPFFNKESAFLHIAFAVSAVYFTFKLRALNLSIQGQPKDD